VHLHGRLRGLKAQGPCALASNSTVMVRLVSTWVLAGCAAALPGTWRSDRARMLMPVASQMRWYNGTRP